MPRLKQPKPEQSKAKGRMFKSSKVRKRREERDNLQRATESLRASGKWYGTESRT